MESDIIKMVRHLPHVAGLRQVLKGLMKGKLKCIVIARDCEEFVHKEIDKFNKGDKVPVYVQSTMSELASICGVDVDTAVVGILNE